MKRILLVDDDVAVTNYLMVFLVQTDRFEIEVANDSREVPGLLEGTRFDVVLLDMDMPYLSGMEILKRMRARGDDTPVIVLTGVADVDLAVRAMKLGAFDYLTKPADDDKLIETIDTAIAHGSLQRSIERLPPQLSVEDLNQPAAFAPFPTQDPGMIRVLHQAERMAGSDLSVFVLGERGVGKEALARAIHEASPRRTGPFVPVDVAAQDPAIFAADFFGEARDWTGAREERSGFLEEAAGGTLFLDEIDRLAFPVQVRLKRVLQTGEFYRERSTTIHKADVRVIAASTCDLTGDQYRSAFSRDLLYHLMVNALRVPPLRERPGDLPLLADHFLQRERRATGRQVRGFTSRYLELLARYEFPDNVQELETIVRASLVAAENGEIDLDALPAWIRDHIEG